MDSYIQHTHGIYLQDGFTSHFSSKTLSDFGKEEGNNQNLFYGLHLSTVTVMDNSAISRVDSPGKKHNKTEKVK